MYTVHIWFWPTLYISSNVCYLLPVYLDHLSVCPSAHLHHLFRLYNHPNVCFRKGSLIKGFPLESSQQGFPHHDCVPPPFVTSAPRFHHAPCFASGCDFPHTCWWLCVLSPFAHDHVQDCLCVRPHLLCSCLCVPSLQEFKQKLEDARTQLLPKRKFGFSRKTARVKGSDLATAAIGELCYLNFTAHVKGSDLATAAIGELCYLNFTAHVKGSDLATAAIGELCYLDFSAHVKGSDLATAAIGELCYSNFTALVKGFDLATAAIGELCYSNFTAHVKGFDLATAAIGELCYSNFAAHVKGSDLATAALGELCYSNFTARVKGSDRASNAIVGLCYSNFYCTCERL